jgi:hypothetical protein
MTTRRLAAIFADVVGFSPMMSLDEEGTHIGIITLQTKTVRPQPFRGDRSRHARTPTVWKTRFPALRRGRPNWRGHVRDSYVWSLPGVLLLHQR